LAVESRELVGRDEELALLLALLDARDGLPAVAVVTGEAAIEGIAVRYVRTTFLPDDETCFHIFESASEDAVGEACRRAGIRSGRIVPAVE
jgi:hypothetical protein